MSVPLGTGSRPCTSQGGGQAGVRLPSGPAGVAGGACPYQGQLTNQSSAAHGQAGASAEASKPAPAGRTGRLQGSGPRAPWPPHAWRPGPGLRRTLSVFVRAHQNVQRAVPAQRPPPPPWAPRCSHRQLAAQQALAASTAWRGPSCPGQATQGGRCHAASCTPWQGAAQQGGTSAAPEDQPEDHGRACVFQAGAGGDDVGHLC